MFLNDETVSSSFKLAYRRGEMIRESHANLCQARHSLWLPMQCTLKSTQVITFQIHHRCAYGEKFATPKVSEIKSLIQTVEEEYLGELNLDQFRRAKEIPVDVYRPGLAIILANMDFGASF